MRLYQKTLATPCDDLLDSLLLNLKSMNSAYRQAGTKDHEVRYKVA
jgi:hypothetical protein